MKNLFKKVAVLMLGVFVLSCSSDGAAGPAGTNGTNGSNGTNGNANVIGTNTVTISNWTASNNNSLWYSTLTASGITQAIVDKGTVSVFENDGASGWLAIPYTFGNISCTFGFGVGFINIYYTNTNLAAITNPGATTYRCVIISASNKMANPKTNWKDYNQVKQALNLED
jgi:hypothetical protein